MEDLVKQNTKVKNHKIMINLTPSLRLLFSKRDHKEARDSLGDNICNIFIKGLICLSLILKYTSNIEKQAKNMNRHITKKKKGSINI